MRNLKFMLRIVLILIISIITSDISYSQELKKAIPLPQNGKLHLTISNDWNINIKQPEGNLPPSIIIAPKTGNSFKFFITPLWDPKKGKVFNDDHIRKIVQNDGNKMLSSSREKAIVINKIIGKFAKGYYFQLTDKSPKPNEFLYIIRAGVGVGNLLLIVTLLTNEKNSKNINRALEMLKTAYQSGK